MNELLIYWVIGRPFVSDTQLVGISSKKKGVGGGGGPKQEKEIDRKMNRGQNAQI